MDGGKEDKGGEELVVCVMPTRILGEGNRKPPEGYLLADVEAEAGSSLDNPCRSVFTAIRTGAENC